MSEESIAVFLALIIVQVIVSLSVLLPTGSNATGSHPMFGLFTLFTAALIGAILTLENRA